MGKSDYAIKVQGQSAVEEDEEKHLGKSPAYFCSGFLFALNILRRIHLMFEKNRWSQFPHGSLIYYEIFWSLICESWLCRSLGERSRLQKLSVWKRTPLEEQRDIP